jgi:N-acetylmuramoyl-L-alanine amidase
VTSRPPIRSFALLCAAATLYAQSPMPPRTAKPPARPASTANDVAFPVSHPAGQAARSKPRAPRPVPAPFSFDTIVLDPAHGGSDSGARIDPDTLEKDVNLAFANRLKQMLSDSGLTVVMTRTTDAIVPKPPPAELDEDGNPVPQPAPKPIDITPEQRVETANRARAFACVLLHASNGGHGVHLYTSSLTPPNAAQTIAAEEKPIVPWDTAQTASLANSERLAADLSTAINDIRIPLVSGHASVRPIDSMTCPAIAVELAPLTVNGRQTPASDDGYQQRVAEAVVAAIFTWRGHAQALEAAIEAARAIATPTPEAPAPAKKPRPKLVMPPVEVPDEAAPAHKPAPIVRVPPPPPHGPPGASR